MIALEIKETRNGTFIMEVNEVLKLNEIINSKLTFIHHSVVKRELCKIISGSLEKDQLKELQDYIKNTLNIELIIVK